MISAELVSARDTGNRFFMRSRTLRSSTASMASAAASRVCPNDSRDAQRSTLATTSRASTGSPSWNRSPGRSRNVQMRPSSTPWPSTICGCTL